MTYKEYFQILEKKFAVKTDIYFKAEKLLTAEPTFIDKKVLDKYTVAKMEWQNAANNYNSFLSYMSKHKINPDDILDISEDMIEL